MERAVLAVDIDHTLTDFLECLVSWHNGVYDTQMSSKNFMKDAFEKAWGGNKDDTQEKMHKFYESKEFNGQLRAVDKASEVLKPLRKYFTLIAVTDRPRGVEKLTREWLDAKFSGVFDKLLMIDHDSKEEYIARRRELFEDMHVKVAIGSDQKVLSETAENLRCAVLVSAVPWNQGAESKKIKSVSDWTDMEKVLENIVKELELKQVDKVHPGPKLSRYTDDLVTVSKRRSASFYANVINSKFNAQHQEKIRLQASEDAISTALHTAELLRKENQAILKKITTRYAFVRARNAQKHRVPKIELILERVTTEA